MPWRIAGFFILCSAALAAAGSADARRRHPIDATPFARAPCSVLANEPCAPYHCSVFNHGPCIPEIDYPIGQNLQLTIRSVPPREDAAKYRRPDHDLDTIGDLFGALRSCWSPPRSDAAREGMQMTVLFSFKRSGEIIAAPRVTFSTREVPQQTRDLYREAITASLNACLPLKFTAALGGALAGRPIMIRYVDNRDLGKQSRVR
jgi:hypothetical protein